MKNIKLPLWVRILISPIRLAIAFLVVPIILLAYSAGTDGEVILDFVLHLGNDEGEI